MMGWFEHGGSVGTSVPPDDRHAAGLVTAPTPHPGASELRYDVVWRDADGLEAACTVT